jgi:hypothetical protein
VVFLASAAAAGITGQVFASRLNEIFLFNPMRPIRSVHDAAGWTPNSIAEHAAPALKAGFAPMDRSADVFSWDPM